jgi:hypothetical protein
VAGSTESKSPTFKNASGRYLLKELFFETALNKDNVVYTLKDQEHLGYPSLYEAYMLTDDPTEYSFAIEYLGSWKHWKELSECTWMKEFVSRWREELDIRMKAKALMEIREVAKSGKDKLPANKYLLEKGWEAKPEKATKGRPTKDQINKEAQRIAEDAARVDNDLERLTNRVN